MKTVNYFRDGKLHRIPVQGDAVAELLETIGRLENHPSKAVERIVTLAKALALAGADDAGAWQIIEWMHERFALDSGLPLERAEHIVRLHRSMSAS